MHYLVDPERSPIIALLRGIARTFGSQCEVVLHDLENPESSVVFIEGSVTGRSIGAPITDLVLQLIRTFGDAMPDLIGYETRTRDGRRVKSSTMFLRDADSSKVVGCVCINIDMSAWDVGMKAIQEFMWVAPIQKELEPSRGGETFAGSVSEVLDSIVNSVLDAYGKASAMMEKEDRLQVVRALDKKGVFLVKGAVDRVALLLGVSKQTVYSYVDETRSLEQSKVI